MQPPAPACTLSSYWLLFLTETFFVGVCVCVCVSLCVYLSVHIHLFLSSSFGEVKEEKKRKWRIVEIEGAPLLICNRHMPVHTHTHTHTRKSGMRLEALQSFGVKSEKTSFIGRSSYFAFI